MQAPTFTTTDQDGNAFTLPDKGVIILYFYPKANTPGCTKESKAFAERYEQFIEAGALILGISPDEEKAICSFKDKYSLPFSLLTDTDHSIAETYGVWGEKQFMGKTYEGIHRTTILIQDGEIIEQWKHRPGKTEEEILRKLHDAL